MGAFNTQIAKYVLPEKIELELRKMHRGMVISSDSNESIVDGYVNDIEWNAFDLSHRVYVHRTYLEHMPEFSGRDFSVNLTRLGTTPFFTQVANTKLEPGFLIQSMVLWGIFYIYQIVELTQREEQVHIKVSWHIASHRLFRLLHRPLNWRMKKLQAIQDEEDLVIRNRRYKLRKAGFRFKTDVPDFLNSNDLSNHLVQPVLHNTVRFSLTKLAAGRVERFVEGPVELLVELTSNGISVWSAVCPHEGGALTPEDVCDGIAQCSWHGLRYAPIELNQASKSRGHILNWTVEIEGDDLVVSKRQAA